MRFKRIDYNLNVMRQSTCLLINPITVDGCHRLNCDNCLGGVMGSVMMCIFNVD